MISQKIMLKQVVHKKEKAYNVFTHLLMNGENMKKIAISTLMAFAMVASTAHAAGCIKGAVVGGVAGHYAGHHAVMGAMAGCAVGHHMAKKEKEKEQAQKAAQVQHVQVVK